MDSIQTALITGSSSGIGLAITQFLLKKGWRVKGIDLNQPTQSHPALETIQVNVTDEIALQQAIEQVLNVDAVIHAAGILRVGKLGNLSSSDGALMWQIHVQAISQILNILVPKMITNGSGRIVLIGSRVAQGKAGRSQYAGTKAALIAMARSWASELITDGITVNVVSPAATNTAMLQDPARKAETPNMPPLGRLIEPEEIAAMVEYLLSPAAAAITGQDIQICGGASLS